MKRILPFYGNSCNYSVCRHMRLLSCFDRPSITEESNKTEIELISGVIFTFKFKKSPDIRQHWKLLKFTFIYKFNYQIILNKQNKIFVTGTTWRAMNGRLAEWDERMKKYLSEIKSLVSIHGWLDITTKKIDSVYLKSRLIFFFSQKN